MPRIAHRELIQDFRNMDQIISYEGEALRNNPDATRQARYNWAFAVALTHILTILIRKEESREN